MTCRYCQHEFCWRCKGDYRDLGENKVRGRCNGNKVCEFKAFNQSYHWGASPVTRLMAKSVAYPVLGSLAVAGAGVGIGVGIGVGAAVVGIGSVSYGSFVVGKELYRHRKSLSFRSQTPVSVPPPTLSQFSNPFDDDTSFEEIQMDCLKNQTEIVSISQSISPAAASNPSILISQQPRTRSHTDLSSSVVALIRSNSAPCLHSLSKVI